MYEFVISAIPSTALALFQPNTKRVQGKFIPYVLSRAIPGALTMAIGILTFYVIRCLPIGETIGFVSGGVETEEYKAMLTLALTFCGLVILYRICQPFNLFRGCLFILSAFLCAFVAGVPVLAELVLFGGWSTLQFQLPQILLLVIVVQASFPISNFLIKTFDLINTADED